MTEIKVVHVSNIHLGRRFPGFEPEAEAMRSDDVKRVFEDLVDYIIKENVDLLLVAGDLFDKMNPRRETISLALKAFGSIKDQLPDTRIVMTPGTEELFTTSDGNLDCSLKIFEHLSNVIVIGTGQEAEFVDLEFSEENVRISSCRADILLEPDFKQRNLPIVRNQSGIFLLSTQLRRGHAMRIDDAYMREEVLPKIKGRGYSYAALGGRHRLNLLESGEFTAIYPGSLEHFNIDRDRERKCFITFNIKNGIVSAPETVRTRARPLEFINITCNMDYGLDELESAMADLGRRGSKDKFLYITMNGSLHSDIFDIFKSGETLYSLREKYACVHLENRLMLMDPDREYNIDMMTVSGPAEEFRATVENEINEAAGNSDEVKLLKELLEMGLSEIEEGP